jgi:gluconolactonase
MRSLLILACLITPWPYAAAAQDQPEGGSQFQVTGDVQRVADGFEFVEGPTMAADGTVFFTDIPADRIMAWRDSEPVSTWVQPAGHANGLMFESGGDLIACQMDGQVVAYDLATRKMRVLADRYDGKRFNAPNDLVVDAEGGIYFTDPLYRAPEPLPQTVQAVYYIAVDGKVSRVSEDLPAPNGIGLSPDGRRLYVVPSMSAEMLVYDVQGAGKLSSPKIFCRLRQAAEGDNSGGDGMTVDQQGNVMITTNLGVQVFSAAGQWITTIKVPEHPANVAFAGPSRNILVITARTGVYRVPVSTTGLPPARLRIGN